MTRYISAKIGPFDGDLTEYTLEEGASVQDLLDKADLSISSGQEINDFCSNEVELDDDVRDGERYLIVGSYKNGNQ